MPTDTPTLDVVNSIFDQESYVATFGCNNPDSRILPRAVDGSTEKYWCDRTGLQAEDTGIIFDLVTLVFHVLPVKGKYFPI